MSVTISNSAHGHKMVFSPGTPGTRGFAVEVRSIATMCLALEHWFGKHAQEDDCPICQRLKQQRDSAVQGE